MKYKVGDKVRVRSKGWYDKTKSRYGDIECGNYMFYQTMSHWCGEIITIAIAFDAFYKIKEDNGMFKWTDEMIEGLVEEETKFGTAKNPIESKSNANSITQSEVDVIEKAKTYWDSIKDAWICPEGYQFKDENGNVINATKIVLEKKKKEYPKTYEECCYVLGFENTEMCFEGDYRDINPPKEQWKRLGLMNQLNKLLICRDAYWKIAGEEMKLGKLWTPQDTNAFSIFYDRLTCEIEKQDGYSGANSTLEFPTAEMRDAFYENFKELINGCKELL